MAGGEILAPLVWRPSPNYSSRRGVGIRRIVWHATAGAYEPSVRWLCTPTLYNADGSVKSGPDASAHLVIREDGGEVSQLVRLADKAWHAEIANADSIGVEHASLSATFASSAQERQSARVFAWLCWTFRIPPRDAGNTGHGLIRHRSLGAAGGGHSDGPPDAAWLSFLTAVHLELARGGFRKVWAR